MSKDEMLLLDCLKYINSLENYSTEKRELTEKIKKRLGDSIEKEYDNVKRVNEGMESKPSAYIRIFSPRSTKAPTG